MNVKKVQDIKMKKKRLVSVWGFTPAAAASFINQIKEDSK